MKYIRFIISTFIFTLALSASAQTRYVGDANNDGKVDIEDVTLLINAVVNNTSFADGVGDMNKDNILDTNDVDLLVQEILKNQFSEFEEESEFVDLGLSVKWRSRNVGANAPEEYGSYLTMNEEISCGDGSRMPTKEEAMELLTKCTWTKSILKGVAGYLVTGPSSKSIFMPAGGCKISEENKKAGSMLYYWTITKNEDTSSAYVLSNSGYSELWMANCEYGMCVRPIKSE